MNEYYLKTKKYTCKDTKEVCIGYENYLQTEHWKRFRDSIIKQRKKCECCGAIEQNTVNTYREQGAVAADVVFGILQEAERKIAELDHPTEKGGAENG